jgi:hypothetical protein
MSVGAPLAPWRLVPVQLTLASGDCSSSPCPWRLAPVASAHALLAPPPHPPPGRILAARPVIDPRGAGPPVPHRGPPRDDGGGALPADPERVWLPRRAGGGHHPRRALRVRGPGGVRHRDRRHARDGPGGLRHRLRDDGGALGRGRAGGDAGEAARVQPRGHAAGGDGGGRPVALPQAPHARAVRGDRARWRGVLRPDVRRDLRPWQRGAAPHPRRRRLADPLGRARGGGQPSSGCCCPPPTTGSG